MQHLWHFLHFPGPAIRQVVNGWDLGPGQSWGERKILKNIALLLAIVTVFETQVHLQFVMIYNELCYIYIYNLFNFIMTGAIDGIHSVYVNIVYK